MSHAMMIFGSLPAAGIASGAGKSEKSNAVSFLELLQSRINDTTLPRHPLPNAPNHEFQAATRIQETVHSIPEPAANVKKWWEMETDALSFVTDPEDPPVIETPIEDAPMDDGPAETSRDRSCLCPCCLQHGMTDSLFGNSGIAASLFGGNGLAGALFGGNGMASPFSMMDAFGFGGTRQTDKNAGFDAWMNPLAFSPNAMRGLMISYERTMQRQLDEIRRQESLWQDTIHAGGAKKKAGEGE